MTVEKDTSLEDVRATRGKVMVRLTIRAGGVDASSRAVELSIGSIQPISADADDVDTHPPRPHGLDRTVTHVTGDTAPRACPRV